jgi:hypothetical protein
VEVIFRLTIFLILVINSSGLKAGDEDEDEDQLGTWDAYMPEEDEAPINWLDNSHAYLTNQTQSLAGWMDAFFGDPAHDAEIAESFLRLEVIEDWNSEDGNKSKIKIRGRVQMPRLSRRLSLVFSGDEDEAGERDFDREEKDNVGLQFRAADTSLTRTDLTLGISSGHLRPGVRFRVEGPIGQKMSYRLIERIQYEHGENFFSRTQFRLSHSIDDNRVIGWSNRFVYGERTQGVEWRSSLSYQARYRADRSRPIGVTYFTGITGFTRPDSYVNNYNVGFLFRRQVYRDFLFFELEPSFNYRKIDADTNREGLWRVVARLEIALQKDLLRVRSVE